MNSAQYYKSMATSYRERQNEKIADQLLEMMEKPMLDAVFEQLQRQGLMKVRIEAVSLDSSIIKVHPDGTGALKKTVRRPSAKAGDRLAMRSGRGVSDTRAPSVTS